MEHFPIVQALCRAAMASPNEAVRRQVERLRDALATSGSSKEAKVLTGLLTSAEKTKEMTPSRLTTSRAIAEGEELTRNTPLPVDKETSTHLVQVVFPGELPGDAPIFEPIVQTAISSILEGWEHFELLKNAGIPPSRGCLIYGPPGTGKTHLALWMAKQLDLPVVLARLDGLVSSFLGTTSRNIGLLFAFANRYRCVLLLDEFDAIAKLRNDPQEVGEIKRVVNTLLQNLDSRCEFGFTVGITNHDSLLDPAVWRRFEIQLEIPNPNVEARSALIKKFASNLDLPDSYIKLLEWYTEGSSGAEIESLIRMIKRNITLGISGRSFIEELRIVGTLSGGRIGYYNKAIIAKNDEDLVGTLLGAEDYSFSQSDLAAIFNCNKSTISRRVSKRETAS